MDFLEKYGLFLFDLDGLLVNTEELHFQAYKQMISDRGYTLSWDFPEYCTYAHYSSHALRDGIYASLPSLQAEEPDWSILYNQKKNALIKLMEGDFIHLMPGVEQMLTLLDQASKARCVCTHSADDLVAIIRAKNPILNTIPHWITRHDYIHPKPHPECYQTAISQLREPGKGMIGFEDTPRGITALMQTEATPVLISTVPYPEIPSFKKDGVLHYSSFKEFLAA